MQCTRSIGSKLISPATEMWVHTKKMSHEIGLNIEMEAETHLDDSADNGEALIVWENAVRTLTDVQRIIFFIVVTMVVAVAICGNILVVYVNIFIRWVKLKF